MANAGSGKTSRLTARVVRLLLLGVAPERIVCITYTKAAANEMRSRVLSRLRELLLADDAQCKKMVETLLEETPTAEHIQRARGLFASVLDSSTGGLQLTTIHGFCQNILRRFPIEADIAPHFTVLEDSAADEVLRRTKHEVLSGTGTEFFNEALALIGNRGGETRFETIANDIISKRRLWRRVWHLQSPESLRAHLYALHGVEVGLTREQLQATLMGSLSDSDLAALRGALAPLLAHKTKSYREFAEKLGGWLQLEDAERIKENAMFLDIFLTKTTPRKERQYLLDKKDHPEGSALRAVVDHAVASCLRYLESAAALACAEESFAVAVLADALLLSYHTAKIARHALDYDDLIDKTLELCIHPDKLGWVMAKLDHRIDHLLIDEAQDNSPEQWKLAHVLVEELIANNEGVGGSGHPRSLMVVGDEKQSIYSFQGAAPEEFSKYQIRFRDILSAESPSPMHSDTLTNSYRSTEAVLKIVDHVGAQTDIAKALSAVGNVPAHVLKRTEAAGRVVLYPPIIAPEKEASEPLVIPTEYKIAMSAPQQLAEHIAATIAQWLQAKQLVAGKPMRAGDILILVHRRKPLMQPLIRCLQRRGIPVAGIDRLTLSEHLAVTDILALMRWCGTIGDDLALAQVLRSPIIGMRDDELRTLAYGRAGMLWSEVTNPWLAQVRAQTQLTPYDFLTYVLEVSGKRTDFARRFGEEVHEVLDELKAQAGAMPEGMACTLAQFVDWMEKNTREVKREQEAADANHVRIMTVHGSKGLEAPVVLVTDTTATSNKPVADTSRELTLSLKSVHGQELPVMSISAESKEAPRRNEAKQLKQNKLLAEYYRLLYVALTRARDELHIFGIASKKGELKKNSWYEVVSHSMREIAVEEGELLVLADVRDATGAKESAQHDVAHTALPAWLNAAPVQEISALATLSPSGLEVAEPSPYALSASRGARQRGVHIHRVLELLQADADAAHIAKLVKHVAPEWNMKEQADVAANITQLFTQEKWLWAHERFAEVNVAGNVSHDGAQIPFAGQIDLLVKTPSEIIILDYKTGAHVAKSAGEVSRNYLLQLKIYRELVRQIYPGLSVRCAILWTAEPSVMWLDEAVENTRFPDKSLMLKTTVAA